MNQAVFERTPSALKAERRSLDVDTGNTDARGGVVIVNQDVGPESDTVAVLYARFTSENDAVGGEFVGQTTLLVG